jgi:iron complex outermembrane receptor protein
MLRVDDVFTNILTRESLLPGFYDYWTENNSGYLLMDVRLAFRINDLMRLSLMVKNIGNVEYMGRPGDVQPQRSFLMRIGIAF